MKRKLLWKLAVGAAVLSLTACGAQTTEAPESVEQISVEASVDAPAESSVESAEETLEESEVASTEDTAESSEEWMDNLVCRISERNQLSEGNLTAVTLIVRKDSDTKI
mgnify:CR=1 FL=1